MIYLVITIYLVGAYISYKAVRRETEKLGYRDGSPGEWLAAVAVSALWPYWTFSEWLDRRIVKLLMPVYQERANDRYRRHTGVEDSNGHQSPSH